MSLSIHTIKDRMKATKDRVKAADPWAMLTGVIKDRVKATKDRMKADDPWSILASVIKDRVKAADPWSTLAIVVCVLGVLANYVYFRRVIFDDAYITYRFAQNFAAGDGLVFNVGERVFGTSSPLSALLLGVLGFFGFNIAATGGLLFALSMGAVAFLGFAAIRGFGAPIAGLLFAGWLLLGLGYLSAYWGLETSFYIALLLASVHAARSGKETTAGVIAGLAVLARYDGGIGALVLAALIASRTRRFPMRYAVAGCAVVLPWLAFAQLYYGSFLPQTLSAKAQTVGAFDYMSSVLNTHINAASPFRDFGLGPLDDRFFDRLFALLLVGGVFAGLRQLIKIDRWALYYGVTAVLLWFGYGQIGPPPAHHWHTASAAVLAALFCVACWAAAIGQPPPNKWRTLIGLGLVLTIVLATPKKTSTYANNSINSDVYRNRAIAYQEMAQFINDHELNDLSVMTAEPGYLSYLSHSPVIDLAGLVTQGNYMHGPAEQHTGLDESMKKYQPGFVVLHPGADPTADFFDYINVYTAFSTRVLAMRPDVFAERFDAMAERQLAGGADQPSAQAAPVRGTWTLDATDDPITAVANSLGGLLPPASPIVIGDKRQPAFSTTRDPSVWNGMETPPFLIDFDRLVFEFEGTHISQTSAQLVIGGQVVLYETGNKQWHGGRIRAQRQITWPLSAWRGRTAKVRFIDRAPSGHRVTFTKITAQNDGSQVWQDFESGWPANWTVSGDAEPPQTSGTWRELAIRKGLELMVSDGAASTLNVEGPQQFYSPSFALPSNLTFLVYDQCASACRVELWVGGRPVRSHLLEGTGKLTPVFWGFKRPGRMASLNIVDDNPDADQGLVIDHITHAN